MFIVNLFGQKQLFLNDKTDDFISGLKKLYECEESDIESFYIDEEDQKLIRREMRLNPNKRYEFDLVDLKLLEIVPPSKKTGDFKEEIDGVAVNYSDSDLETQEQKIEVLAFNVKKVLKFNYETIQNAISGESYNRVLSLTLEE